MTSPQKGTPEYKKYLRPLGECVRKPDCRPRGSVEVKFLEKELWPILDRLPEDIQESRNLIQYAIEQLKAFFAGDKTPGGSFVDEQAAEIYVWFLNNKLL